METATKDCRVILANERIVPVTVALCFGETPPFYYLAPHTAHLKPFVVIDRGWNAHGSLTEEFYLASNECADGEFAVLWMSNSGDQLEDSISRLHPIAFS